MTIVVDDGLTGSDGFLAVGNVSNDGCWITIMMCSEVSHQTLPVVSIPTINT